MEKLREELNKYVEKYGPTHIRTIQKSQQLDLVIVEEQRKKVIKVA